MATHSNQKVIRGYPIPSTVDQKCLGKNTNQLQGKNYKVKIQTKYKREWDGPTNQSNPWIEHTIGLYFYLGNFDLQYSE